MKQIVLVFGLLFIGQWIFGQNGIDSSLVNDNPYTAIYNHLFYLQAEDYDPGRAALSLPSDVPERQKLAIQLKQILDGKGLWIDLNRIPKNPDYTDSVQMDQIYFLDKSENRIYLEKTDNGWFYSRSTVSSIPELHKKVYPFGTQLITMFQGPIWQIKVMGIKLWKWLGIGVLLVLALLLFSLFTRISQIVISRFLKKRLDITPALQKSLITLSRVIGLLIATRFVLYLLPMLQITAKANAQFVKGLNILGIFFVILMIRHIAKIAFSYFTKLAKKTENTLDDQLLPVLERLVVIIIWAFGIIYILDYLDDTG